MIDPRLIKRDRDFHANNGRSHSNTAEDEPERALTVEIGSGVLR
jgi:hypothetical protein